MNTLDFPRSDDARISALRVGLARTLAQRRDQSRQIRVLQVVALSAALLITALLWSRPGDDGSAGGESAADAAAGPTLLQGGGRVCTSWQPTGQSCPGGCIWERDCFWCAEINPPSGCEFNETEYKCVAGSTMYCPLAPPAGDSASLRPTDPGMASWALASDLAWSSTERDWVNRQGETLQTVIEASGRPGSK